MSLIGEIKASSKVLIIGHVRPDGDCLGSGLAIMKICLDLGKRADFLIDSALPAHLEFMPGFECVNDKRLSGYDFLIAVDCADRSRMGKYQSFLNGIKSFNIDHHYTNNKFGTFNAVEDKSSTCEIVYGLLKDEGVLNAETAQLLLCGLSTDTGHFMHSNTTAEVFDTAAGLARLGADVNYITDKLYKNATVEKTRLSALAINSMRFYKDNRVCFLTVKKSDLSASGCGLSDTEGLIDLGMNIGCVEVAVCVTEQSANNYKVSLRSKKTDVSAAAAVFGGGGHKLAAGCVVCGFYEDVIDKLLKAVTDGME